MPASIVVGIGNEYRHDDGVGMAAVQLLQQEAANGSTTIYIAAGMIDGASLLDYWSSGDRVIIIDAVATDEQSGTIYHFDALAQELPTAVAFGDTHGFGVSEAVMLATAIDQLPAALHVFAVAGADFSSGSGLSADVERVLPELVAQVKQQLASWSE